jgi:hypothetical protein
VSIDANRSFDWRLFFNLTLLPAIIIYENRKRRGEVNAEARLANERTNKAIQETLIDDEHKYGHINLFSIYSRAIMVSFPQKFSALFFELNNTNTQAKLLSDENRVSAVY